MLLLLLLHEFSSPTLTKKNWWEPSSNRNPNARVCCVLSVLFDCVCICMICCSCFSVWCVITNYKRFKNPSLPVCLFFSSFDKQKQKITIFLWSETIYINEALFHNFSGCFPNGNNYREGGINRTYIQTCILFLSFLSVLRSRSVGDWSAIFGSLRCASLRIASLLVLLPSGPRVREPTKRHKESVSLSFANFLEKWWSSEFVWSACFCSLCLVCLFFSASFASSF